MNSSLTRVMMYSIVEDYAGDDNLIVEDYAGDDNLIVEDYAGDDNLKKTL
jgi:hypothetical protein